MGLGFGPFNFLRKSGLDRLTDIYQEDQEQEPNFDYQRGPMTEQLMQHLGNAPKPEDHSPGIGERILASIMSATGKHDPDFVNRKYERAKKLYQDKTDQLKAGASLENQEIDNRRISENARSTHLRRKERTKNEIRDDVYRTNKDTAAGMHRNKVQSWRESEKNEDQAATAENRNRLQRNSDRSYGQRERFHNDTVANRNNPRIHAAEQGAIDLRAGDQLEKEFGNYFNITVDPKTKRKIRTIKPEFDSDDNPIKQQINQRFQELQEQIAERRLQDYDLDDEEAEAEIDAEDEEEIDDQEAPQIQASPTAPNQVQSVPQQLNTDPRWKLFNFMLNLGRK